MASSDYLVNIQAQLKGPAVSELDGLGRAIEAAKSKFTELESAANKAASKLQTQGATVAKIQGDLAKAQAGGDTSKIEALTSKLGEAEAKFKELASASEEANSALEAQKGPLQDLANKYADLKKSEDAQKQSAENALKASDGLSKLPGPLREIGAKAKELQEGWKALSGSLGSTGAMAAVAAAGIALVVVAVIAAGAAIAAFVVKLGNARRDLLLTQQAMLGSAEAAKAVQGSYVGITRETGVASGRLAELTKALHDAKVPADQMPDALKALAQQEAALGDTSGTQALIDQLKSGKKSVSELGSEMEKQFGDVARKKALGLDQQMEILRANVEDLFGGANIEGVLKGFQRLIGLLDSSTASGRAIKAVFDAMFGGLGGAEAIFTGIERFVIVFMTQVLKAINFVRRLGATLGLTGGDGKSAFEGMDVAAGIAKVAFIGAAIALAPLLLLVGAVVGVVYAAVAAFGFIRSAGSQAGQAISGAWEAVKSFFESLDLASVGADIIDGLVQGIKGAAGKVAAALTDAAKGGIDAAKSALGIASPSKVFMELGAYTGEGMAIGVDRSASEVETSMANLVEPPAPAEAASGTGPGGAGVGSVTINIYGVEKAEDVAGKIDEAIGNWLLTGATQLGAPVTT